MRVRRRFGLAIRTLAANSFTPNPPTTATGTTPGAGLRGAARGAIVGDLVGGDAGAGADYLVLDIDGAEKLIPFVAAIVPTVDMVGGEVVVDPPEGLFDL